MAIVVVNDVNVDFDSGQEAFFDLYPVSGGQGYINIIQLIPGSTTVEFGYILIVPRILIGNLLFELSTTYKYYPKGRAMTFVVPIYAGVPAGAQISMSLIPISIFKGRATPAQVTARLSYEDALFQPIGFG